MNSKHNKWTTFEVMRGKPIQTLLLSAIIVTIFKMGIVIYGDKAALTVNEAANLRAIGISPVLYILVIPLFPIMAFILRGYYSRKLPKQTQYQEVDQTVNNTGFKWNIIYSLIIGYVLYIVGGLLLKMIVDIVEKNMPEEVMSGGNVPVLLLLSVCEFALYIAVIMLVIKFVKAFHKMMIKKTGTNQALITALSQGYYCDQLYPQYRNKNDMVKIMKVLETGCATSIKGACSLYSTIQSITGTAKTLGIIGGVLFIIMAVLTCGLASVAKKEVASCIEPYDEYIARVRHEEILRRIDDIGR